MARIATKAKKTTSAARAPTKTRAASSTATKKTATPIVRKAKGSIASTRTKSAAPKLRIAATKAFRTKTVKATTAPKAAPAVKMNKADLEIHVTKLEKTIIKLREQIKEHKAAAKTAASVNVSPVKVTAAAKSTRALKTSRTSKVAAIKAETTEKLKRAVSKKPGQRSPKARNIKAEMLPDPAAAETVSIADNSEIASAA
ncbi:hypothetical protein ACELLULO517_26840 [Acidisoma cellulosilytica]|uniref:Uncharacterized protein n=1 Tax=Acidisoma cellulosilyticum TaxID=2802395 RepID=A0A964E6W7_9PROT|nr:hypothetical protein [Acidisoma cellulosilyticum]MCB8883892.1 hypothetical protein [Acidisoma cellulosilyticum]